MFVDQIINPFNMFNPVASAGGIVKAAAKATHKVAKQSVTFQDKANSHSYKSGQAKANVEFLFPEGVEGMNANDVQQGGLNDCYFLSAVSALAHHRPEEIKKMIRANPNGTYSVKFPGAKYSVTVNQPKDSWRSDVGRDLHNNSNNSHYVQVLEKAFVEYTMQENSGTINATVEDAKESLIDVAWGLISPAAMVGRAISKMTSDDNVTDPNEHFKYGGFQHSGIEVLTGNSTDTDILKFTSTSTLLDKVQTALNNDRIITASTVMAGSDKHNLSDDHVYSVIGYDPDKQTLTIRNPYGNGSDATNTKYSDGLNDGIFELTTDEFFDYFNLIAYEQKN